MRKSITNTLGIIFLIVALIPLLVMVMFVSPITQRTMQDELVRNLDGVVQKQVEHVKSWMDDRKGDARVIAENPFVTLATQYTEADKEYSELLKYLDYTKYFEYIRDEYGYKEVIISDRNGIVKVATESKLISSDVSRQDYFLEAIKGNTFVSQVQPSLVPIENEEGELEKGMPTMFVSAPIINKFGTMSSPDVLGVVALRIDVAKINKVMHNTKIGLTGETYLIDKDGYMLTESRFADNLKKKGVIRKRTTLELKVTDPGTGESTKGVKECLKKAEGYDGKGYKDYRGVNVLGFWRWIPEYEWGVIAEIDIEEGYRAAFKLRNTTVSIFMMLAVGVMIFAFFLGKKISNPIRSLTEATKRITAGLKTSPEHLTSLIASQQMVRVKRNDEIGELAESFNIMAESVVQKTKELSEANNTITLQNQQIDELKEEVKRLRGEEAKR
ncbi:MAG TPA: cache domain-containing protein [Candidatus Brocadiia bacterium]|nr:HAMP domain-containing protein [Planctomycetota bacterium]MDO8093768.1 cache domain-containing protein [Candidatus Brocadiales bacterium]